MSIIAAFWNGIMSYTAWSFFVLTAAALIVYYVLPRKYQWSVLLIESAVFYYLASGKDLKSVLLFVATIVFSYIAGRLLERKKNRALLVVSLVVTILPLLLVKGNDFVWKRVVSGGIESLIIPLGLSFYSLQIYSYLYDIYTGKNNAQKNFLKYALYVSFFPHIIQGPIPRYDKLGSQLYEGHAFEYETIAKGFQLVIWGFFLKYVIAERAGIIVNTVFDHYTMYQGAFALLAGILYSIQLYTDFLACVCMSCGVAEMFGIRLTENFRQPYRSRSVKEFWRRWHISLSSWLRDYVYIPLGGSRKGMFRRYLNLILTFLISGIWHGNGLRFIAWGGIHAFLQIAGDLLHPVSKRIKHLLQIRDDAFVERQMDRVVTFFFVMLAWIIFRANSLRAGLYMIRSIFTVYNPWVLWDDSILGLGLDWKNCVVLVFAILLLILMEHIQEYSRTSVRERVMMQPLIARWTVYLMAISVIVVFGVYGYGYNASDFIYRGF